MILESLAKPTLGCEHTKNPNWKSEALEYFASKAWFHRRFKNHWLWLHIFAAW